MSHSGLFGLFAFVTRPELFRGIVAIRTEFRVELAGGQWPVLAMAPDGSGVLYCSEGSAWIRRFSSLVAE